MLSQTRPRPTSQTQNIKCVINMASCEKVQRRGVDGRQIMRSLSSGVGETQILFIHGIHECGGGLPDSFCRIILSDFGTVVDGGLKRNHDAQPNIYRSPEVMLSAPWSYPIDIWNVRAMIWDVFEGDHPFYRQDPSGKGHLMREHLAEVVGLLGLSPLDPLKRGVRSKEFPSEDGKFHSFSQLQSLSMG